MNKYPKIDFKNHELKITDCENITVYELKKLDTIVCSFVFIVGHGIMSVTGDYGNWIFCREFHPSAGDKVSRCYFDEKLEIMSQQKSKAFNSEDTLKKIKNFKKEFVSIYDRPLNDDEKEWINELENSVYDQIEYENVAYRNTPPNIDYQDIPYSEVRHQRLEYVYDAFDEICSVMKKRITKIK
jgi:hypothetical protein